jgi:hypothetical protein
MISMTCARFSHGKIMRSICGGIIPQINDAESVTGRLRNFHERWVMTIGILVYADHLCGTEIRTRKRCEQAAKKAEYTSAEKGS